MKKLLSVVLALALCLTAMMGCFAVSAETVATKATINIAGGEAIKAGETATVTVTGSDFTDVCAADLVITLPAGFVLVSVSEAGEVLVNDDNGVYYVYNETANTVKYIDVFNFNDEVKDLDLAIAVKAPDAAEDGTYEVTGAVVAANIDEEFLGVTVNSGAITVQNEVACEHANADYALANVTETAFEYTATCPDCSEELIKSIEIGAPYTTNVNIARSIEPANDISMFFKFPVAQISAFSNYVLAVTKEETDTIYLTEYEEGKSGSTSVYSFKYPDLNAWDMARKVDVVLYGYSADLDQMIAIKTSEDYSVLAYAVSTIKKSSTSATLKTALIDLLNYGAAIQEFKNMYTDVLPNAVTEDLTAEMLALGTQTVPDASTAFKKIETDTLYPNTTYGKVQMGKSILPENTLNMQMKFNKAYTGDYADLYVKFEYNDRKGNVAEPVVLNVAESSYTTSDGYTAVKFDKAPMSTLNYPVCITVYHGNPNSDDAEILTYTEYSIETYIAKYITSSDPKLVKVLQTVYNYGYSLAAFSGVPALS